VLGVLAVATSRAMPAFAQFAVRGVWLSLYLGIFNLLPVPPLDGSKLLLAARIPMAIYMEISRFGFMLLIVAVSVSDFGRWMSDWSIWGARAILRVLQ
jgi:Zn-dependent protease